MNLLRNQIENAAVTGEYHRSNSCNTDRANCTESEIVAMTLGIVQSAHPGAELPP
jgi:hypothetical protein